MRKQNPLDWFHEAVCTNCDIQNKECPHGSTVEANCIQAYIAKKLSEASK